MSGERWVEGEGGDLAFFCRHTAACWTSRAKLKDELVAGPTSLALLRAGGNHQ